MLLLIGEKRYNRVSVDWSSAFLQSSHSWAINAQLAGFSCAQQRCQPPIEIFCRWRGGRRCPPSEASGYPQE
jgi:hypothetical protein